MAKQRGGTPAPARPKSNPTIVAAVIGAGATLVGVALTALPSWYAAIVPPAPAPAAADPSAVSAVVVQAGRTGSTTITIVNGTGQAITTIHITDAGTSTWGSDILGGTVLPDGGQLDVSLGDSQCRADVIATLEDGSNLRLPDVDVCTQTEVFLGG